jgi:hypothetical protein
MFYSRFRLLFSFPKICHLSYFLQITRAQVKYGGRSPKFIWAPCHVMCTAVLIGWGPATPPLPSIWTHITRALLVSKDRRHLFVTTCTRGSRRHTPTCGWRCWGRPGSWGRRPTIPGPTGRGGPTPNLSNIKVKGVRRCNGTTAGLGYLEVD